MEIKFKQWNCTIVASHYLIPATHTVSHDKRKAIILVENNEVIAVATVNMPDYPCEENQVYIKNYSENEGMLQTLIDNNIILPRPVNIVDGKFVAIPLMQLTSEVLKLWEK